MQLAGKVAVITGAGSGMGRAMALRFAQEGASIIAGEWKQDTLDEIVTAVQEAGGEITGVNVDVAIKEEAESLIDTAISRYGQLDILCNNAGVMDRNHGVASVPDEIWERVININLNGPMYATRRAVPIMLEQGGGSIINTVSTAAFGGGAAGVAYTVSKHGMVGLTKSTAWMYGPRGVRCNAIAPGATRTNIVSPGDMALFDPEGSARTQLYTGIIPALLEPEDIAALALFLASDDSRHINGAIIPADGGWLAA